MVKEKRQQNRSLALKAKKESNDEDSSTFDSENEEYAMAVKNFKEVLQKTRKICKTTTRRKKRMSKSRKMLIRQRAFIGGAWSDSGESEDNSTNLKLAVLTPIEESLNVTFYETPPPPKTSSLEEDELVEEEAIEVSKTKPISNDLEDKSLENNEIINIKESKSHPLDNVIGTTHLGLWYPKGSDIETIVYADSDHAGDYVDRKSTSGVCTFMGCCLTSWFSKKQTAFAISITEAKYVSTGKACQQALWMKQARRRLSALG
ncbi:hypothetical protein Tco_0462621 [Tanacetum coccineum]